MSGLGAIYTLKPEGTITIYSTAGREFSLGELTDIINEALLVQKLILIRGSSTFTIVSADEKISPHLVPHVKFAELPNWGRTEIVEVDIPVPESLTGKTESMSPEFQKLLTPLGHIVSAKGKLLTISDAAWNLKRLAALVESLEGLERQAPIPSNVAPTTPTGRDSMGGKQAESSAAKKFPFTMRNVPWNEVFDWYARTSGLSAGSSAKLLLKGQFNFIPPEEKEFTLQEITDIINEELMRQGYLLVRKANSFIVHSADEVIDRTLARSVDASNLVAVGNSELVRVVIPLPAKNKASDTRDELQKMLSPFGSISILDAREKSYLIVIDVASRVRRIVQVTAGPGAEEIPETTPRKNPVEKTFPFRMKAVPWEEVLAQYAEISGLIPILIQKPKGSFTFSSSDPDRRFTLAEITDLLNEGLSPQKLMVVRRQVTFYLHPADEKLDVSLVPRIDISELHTRGKTEVVQVLVPLKNVKGADMGKDLQKLLGPFGSLTYLEKTNTLVIMDTTGSLSRIIALIQQVEAEAKVP